MAVVARPALASVQQCPSPIASLCGSVLFGMEMEVDDSKQQSSALLKSIASRVHAVKERLAFFSKATGSFASRLLRDVLCFRNALLREEGEVDTVVLASRLSSVGYRLSVRNALGGGGPSCFKNLRHEFLLVHGADEFEGVEYVVDLHFRDQFLIPQPTSAYLEVLSMVPQEFVGPVSRLMPVVQDLCSEMAESFAGRGLTLPPWRRTQSMLSKWMPVKVKDTSFQHVFPATAAAAVVAAGAGPDEMQQPGSSCSGSDRAGNALAAGELAVTTRLPSMGNQHQVKIGFAL